MKLFSLSRFKKICITLLACATVVSATVGIVSLQPKVSAASTPATRQQEGISFADGWDIYETKDVIKSVPKTYEAIIHLPTTYKARAGIIVGNYKNGGVPMHSTNLANAFAEKGYTCTILVTKDIGENIYFERQQEWS